MTHPKQMTHLYILSITVFMKGYYNAGHKIPVFLKLCEAQTQRVQNVVHSALLPTLLNTFTDHAVHHARQKHIRQLFYVFVLS